jgi:exopolysaccharide biosynthesis predicted pyruvyltransferase EpsI
VILDNRTGKIASFHRTWTLDSPLVRWADSEEEAVTLAARMT